MRKKDSSGNLIEPGIPRGKHVKGLPTFRSRNGVASRATTDVDLHDDPGTSRRMMKPVQNAEKAWASLVPVTIFNHRVAEGGLFPDARQDPVTAQFDILRTQILQAIGERGWTRIAVTSPTHGCGKSLVAANLALSMARLPSARSVLIDFELRHPELANLFGIEVGSLNEVLSGEQPFESHFRRMGDNLALALNGEAVPGAAETLLSPATGDTLLAVEEHLQPNVIIFDLPPALGSDDVLSILPMVDAVLLVTDATRTTAEDIRACERLFEDRIPLLGVVLNRANDKSHGRYRYGKKRS